MTRHETFKTPNIADKDFVLATDLDGTFLGGTDEDRRKFYAWIEANRSKVGLIFVTGRDPGFIREMTRKQGLPRPDYVIGDVGTTIAQMDAEHMVSPIEELEREIADAWANAGPRVQVALNQVSGLKLQPTLFRYRASYDLDPEIFDEKALDIVAELGLDSLMSDNRFFDVLPKGVSKGPSLLRLLEHLKIQNQRVLVAGDTLNDLSMLALGLPAVAVGGSEARLLDQVNGLDFVHKAKAIGVAGIAEAIISHKLFPAQK